MNTTRFDTAFAKAREFMASGLCAGFAMADADEGPVLSDGLQCFSEKQLPMTPRSRFDIASVFTTVGDMRLFLSDMLHRRLLPKECYDLLFTESFAGEHIAGGRVLAALATAENHP